MYLFDYIYTSIIIAFIAYADAFESSILYVVYYDYMNQRPAKSHGFLIYFSFSAFTSLNCIIH